MTEKAHHLQITPSHMAGNGGIGRYVLAPGSPGRAEAIAGLFDVQEESIITPRHNDTYLGRIRMPDGSWLDVAASSTGMGPGSTEIIATELIAAGARRIVRVGTSGSVQHEVVKVGSFVIATGAVRDETTSRHWAVVEFPAVAHPDTVVALERAAFRLGLASKTFRGVVHTKDSLYARAVFMGPLAAENLAYKEHLIRAGGVSSEMEASVLFVVGAGLSGKARSLAEERSADPGAVKAGTVLGIIGGKDEWATDEQIAEIELQTCRLAVAGLQELAAIDRREGMAI
jgi:uridine phosphorylase